MKPCHKHKNQSARSLGCQLYWITLDLLPLTSAPSTLSLKTLFSRHWSPVPKRLRTDDLEYAKSPQLTAMCNPIRNQTKRLNSHFTKETRTRSSTYSAPYYLLLVTRKMQSKSMMKYCYTASEYLKSKNILYEALLWALNNWSSPTLLVGIEICVALWKAVWQDPSYLLQCVCFLSPPGAMTTHLHSAGLRKMLQGMDGCFNG